MLFPGGAGGPYRIARAIEEPIQLSSGAAIHVGISVGLATYYSDAIASTAELMALAEKALVQAKGQWESSSRTTSA